MNRERNNSSGPIDTEHTIDLELMKQALLIRCVENRLLELFSQGKLNGTIHTCVGQEFVGLAFAGQADARDIIFSNHRCHGHYLSFTKDVDGLVAELMGKSTGVCAGIGGSQHLCKNNFYSNGIQGGIVPVCAGMTLAQKLNRTGQIGMVFLGDGMLGEGIVYETMNIVAKWDIPLLFVCENNYYAQSTPQDINFAGDILRRAGAFGIKTCTSHIWTTGGLFEQARESIAYVRRERKPLFHCVEAYRLNPHSKGDDDRDPQEIERYRKKDPLNIFSQENPALYQEYLKEINLQIDSAIARADHAQALTLDQYCDHPTRLTPATTWQAVETVDVRQVDLINGFFKTKMKEDPKILFIGEDVLSPYGGAFKVARDLSQLFPRQVFSTPISEAAITGLANGLALGGFRPFLEIMFGDFVTLCMDQLLNHASKFYHMYNKQVKCPLVIRLPMGGRRGYGPTHSQTLDKLVLGLPNIKTVALNTLINPQSIYETILDEEEHPVIVIENKLDYGRKIAAKRIANYVYEETDGDYPVVRIRPVSSFPTATIVCYGGMVEIVLETIDLVFEELDLKPELLVLSQISPIDVREIIASVEKTKRLYVIEEGVMAGGIGSEIIAGVTEMMNEKIVARRIAALPVPIPSAKSLESQILPTQQSILKAIAQSLQ